MTNDWRLMGQESYLMNQHLLWSEYSSLDDDHAHCEFCNEKISIRKDDLNFGYCTEDRYYWICGQCYNDFKDMFKWTTD